MSANDLVPVALLYGPGVVAASISCAITSPSAGAAPVVGVPITITGTISQPGTVAVKLGSVLIGAATIAGLSWSCSWTPQSGDVGPQTLNATATATVGGSTGNAVGVSLTVANAQITTAITSPSANANLTQGTPVTITGTISVAGTVVVKLGSTTLGSATVSGLNWSYTWTPQAGDVGLPTINATATATVGGSTANAAGVNVTVSALLSYLGPVSSRASAVPTSLVAGTTSYMSRKFFDATDNIPAVQLKLPNYAVTSNGAAETNSGGTLTATASIEYPAGNFQRITFGGSTSGSTAGDTLLSDLTALSTPIPATHGTTTALVFAASGETCTRSSGSWITDGFYVGQVVTPSGTASNNTPFLITALTATVMTAALATFVNETVTATITGPTRAWIRFFASNTVAMPVSKITTPSFGCPQYVPGGDATVAGGTDQTMGGTVTDDGTGTSLWPIAILGNTARPTFAIFSDSKGVIESDTGPAYGTSDSGGRIGELMRALGGQYGIINLGVPGDKASTLVANGAKRFVDAQAASHVFAGFDINEFQTQTAANVIGFLNTIREAVATKPFYAGTCAPQSTSTDGWATVGNQTAAASNTNRAAFNASIRGSLPVRWTQVLDFAQYVESGGAGSPSGKWNAPNYTVDGTHATANGNKQLVATFGVAPSWSPPAALTAANSSPSLWLEGDVNVTSSGGLVSAWLDQSSNALNATAAGSLRPGLSTTINGKQCISFNGTTALVLPNFANVGAKTIVIVSKLTTIPGTSGDYEPFTLKDPTGPTLTRLDLLNLSGYQNASFIADSPNSVANYVGFNPTLDTGAHAHILTWLGGAISTAANYAVTLDGAGGNTVVASGATGGFQTTDKGSIGARLNSAGTIPGGGFLGDIAFIGVWNRILSPAERAGLKLTLAKWGVQ